MVNSTYGIKYEKKRKWENSFNKIDIKAVAMLSITKGIQPVEMLQQFPNIHYMR